MLSVIDFSKIKIDEDNQTLTAKIIMSMKK